MYQKLKDVLLTTWNDSAGGLVFPFTAICVFFIIVFAKWLSYYMYFNPL